MKLKVNYNCSASPFRSNCGMPVYNARGPLRSTLTGDDFSLHLFSKRPESHGGYSNAIKRPAVKSSWNSAMLSVQAVKGVRRKSRAADVTHSRPRVIAIVKSTSNPVDVRRCRPSCSQRHHHDINIIVASINHDIDRHDYTANGAG